MKIFTGQSVVGADVVVDVGIKLILSKCGSRSVHKHVKTLLLGRNGIGELGRWNQKLTIRQLELEKLDRGRINLGWVDRCIEVCFRHCSECCRATIIG